MESNRMPDGPELPNEIGTALSAFRVRSAQCPNPALLQAAKAGVLPPEAGDRVAQHIEKCPICNSLVQDLSALDESPMQPEERQRVWDRIQARAGAGRPLRTGESRYGWWAFLFRPWPVALASAAIILLVLATGLFRERRQPAAALSQAPAPKAASPSPTAFRLEKPPIMLPASAVMVFRGATDPGSAQWKELQEALVPYRKDDYGGAADRLKRVAEKYPRQAEAHFYLGICRLFLDQDAAAADTLTAAHSQAQGPLLEEANWYLALAYQRLGKASEALPLLEELCRSDGKNSARACLGLKELTVVK